MSDENVEFVRRGFEEVVTRAFEAYWREPRSIAAALEADDLWPEWRQLFALLDPEVEWKTLFLDTTFRGHLGVARGWDDFLSWADHYRPWIEDAEGLGEDHVLAVVAFEGQAKDGPQMSATFYAVFTLRNDIVVRVHEYATRAEALAAVGQLRGS
jgi:ketosteroid isomerase-like protein